MDISKYVTSKAALLIKERLEIIHKILMIANM
jgi:hypothetical protein